MDIRLEKPKTQESGMLTLGQYHHHVQSQLVKHVRTK